MIAARKGTEPGLQTHSGIFSDSFSSVPIPSSNVGGGLGWRTLPVRILTRSQATQFRQSFLHQQFHASAIPVQSYEEADYAEDNDYTNELSR